MTKTEYAEYLRSPGWRDTRNELLIQQTDCERCELPRWLASIAYDQDLHVHHKSYANLGDEKWEDLEVLCRRCHELETFGRSELKKVKEATCEICKVKHWDYREPFCVTCLAVMGITEGMSGILDISIGPHGVIWMSVAESLRWAVHQGKIPLDDLVAQISRRMKYDYVHTISDAEVPF